MSKRSSPPPQSTKAKRAKTADTDEKDADASALHEAVQDAVIRAIADGSRVNQRKLREQFPHEHKEKINSKVDQMKKRLLKNRKTIEAEKAQAQRASELAPLKEQFFRPAQRPSTGGGEESLAARLLLAVTAAPADQDSFQGMQPLSTGGPSSPATAAQVSRDSVLSEVGNGEVADVALMCKQLAALQPQGVPVASSTQVADQEKTEMDKNLQQLKNDQEISTVKIKTLEDENKRLKKDLDTARQNGEDLKLRAENAEALAENAVASRDALKTLEDENEHLKKDLDKAQHDCNDLKLLVENVETTSRAKIRCLEIQLEREQARCDRTSAQKKKCELVADLRDAFTMVDSGLVKLADMVAEAVGEKQLNLTVNQKMSLAARIHTGDRIRRNDRTADTLLKDLVTWQTMRNVFMHQYLAMSKEGMNKEALAPMCIELSRRLEELSALEAPHLVRAYDDVVYRSSKE